MSATPRPLAEIVGDIHLSGYTSERGNFLDEFAAAVRAERQPEPTLRDRIEVAAHQARVIAARENAQATSVASCDLEAIDRCLAALARNPDGVDQCAELAAMAEPWLRAMSAELRQSRQRIAALDADLKDYGVAFGRLAGESVVQHALRIKLQVAALTEKLAAREQICTQFAQVTSVLDEQGVLPDDWPPTPSLERATRVPGLVESVCHRAEAAEALLRQREEQIAQVRAHGNAAHRHDCGIHRRSWTNTGKTVTSMTTVMNAGTTCTCGLAALLGDPPVGTQEQK